MSKKHTITISAAVLLVIVGLFFYWRFSKTQTTPIVTPQTSTPSAVTVNIPGVSPIPALHQDYNALDSTWLVVSKTMPLRDMAYIPADLAVPSGVAANPNKSTEEQQLRSLVHQPTRQLFDAAKAQGFDLYIASGYRSYQLQEHYYSNYVRVSGEAEANKFSAKPGQSEHQTGLAFDLSLASNKCYLETCFGDTDAAKWLAVHAHEYGFILRYPADKTAITGYQYEPWHFRYVGKDLAGALYQSRLTLDEAKPYLDSALKALRDSHQV